MTEVLTDSRPCVQAYDKLRKGEFCASARVTSFLSIACRFHVNIGHISGAANLPSDCTSRHPPECPDRGCQVCKFVDEIEECVVRELSVKDVLEGGGRMPFASRVAWQSTQQECSDLRRVHAHLIQGTRPSKKATKVMDVKRYLRDVHIASDGLLVVGSNLPFQPCRERIVVPRGVLDGLLTALHLRFNHPSVYQMKQLVTRYFYALDIDRALQGVCAACHHCMSLKSMPKALHPQSTSSPPGRIGSLFSMDVIRRYKQCILLLRESVSAYTVTALIENERHET